MTREDKELLLRDICARLPYGLKAEYYDPEAERKTWDEINDVYNTTTIDHVEVGIGQYGLYLTEVKPYLFPMSSMTNEQKKYIRSNYTFGATYELFDWLNKNHFDYRGLIEKGLAIDATGLNIY